MSKKSQILTIAICLLTMLSSIPTTFADSTRDPRFENIYLTKERFDPGRGETTYLNFTLTADADLEITVHDYKGEQIRELFDENDAPAKQYSIAWNGRGVEDEQGTYFFKLYAENSRGEEFKVINVEVEHDTKKNTKPNIFADTPEIKNLPFEPRNNDLFFDFELEVDAEVTIEIRDERRVLIRFIKDRNLVAGKHSMAWDGKDSAGNYVYDGIYEYKIIAENFKGKDTELGNIEVTNTTHAINRISRCANFEDVLEDNRYCAAIKWARDEGIFRGYNDGKFRPNSAINRAEAVKVILTALDIRVYQYDDFGSFQDVDRFAWYADYVKTAYALNIVHGYPDNTFRPTHSVNRAEALAILIKAAETQRNIHGLYAYEQPYNDVPRDSWYFYYAWIAKTYNLTDNNNNFFPSSPMTRAEMADMLYRFYLADLI